MGWAWGLCSRSRGSQGAVERVEDGHTRHTYTHTRRKTHTCRHVVEGVRVDRTTTKDRHHHQRKARPPKAHPLNPKPSSSCTPSTHTLSLPPPYTHARTHTHTLREPDAGEGRRSSKSGTRAHKSHPSASSSANGKRGGSNSNASAGGEVKRRKASDRRKLKWDEDKEEAFSEAEISTARMLLSFLDKNKKGYLDTQMLFDVTVHPL